MWEEGSSLMYGFEGQVSRRGPGLHVAEHSCVRSSLECSSSRFAIASSSVAVIVATSECSPRFTGSHQHWPTSGWLDPQCSSSPGIGQLDQ